jgi:hypothetical protein
VTERQPSWPATPPPPNVPHIAEQSRDAFPPPAGSQPVGPYPAGPHSGGPQSAGPHSAGPYPAGPVPAGWGYPAAARPPSGLFPGPTRPVYREPHPITAAPVLAGLGATLLWFGLFGGLAHDLAAYAWWTLIAAVSAWAVALVLTRLGDRGVAVGVAIASGIGLSIAVAFVTARWIDTYDWPLW